MYQNHTTFFGLLLGLCLLVGGCASEAEEAPAAQNATDTSASLNTLSESEQGEGWQLLFSGQDLSEWRGFKQQDVPQGWTVQDSTIHFSGEGQGGLMTREQYGDFEFRTEWKISEGGNSGIFYKVSEEHDAVSGSGPEYQLIDAENYEGELKDVQKTGANYALNPPATDAVKPAGEWNDTRILVRGNHVEHWLNGEKVVEYELGSEDWQARVDSSKFSDDAGYAQSAQGHIVLQNHGDPVWFRNVKVRPL